MDWYPWLNLPYSQLVGLHQARRSHHALLLHTAEGNGEQVLIYALSRWLMCQQPRGEKSCGQCHGCRLMLSGNHPDWHVLAAEKGKASLGIDAVRQLTDKLYSHAQRGGGKVIWIPQTEQLTEACASALLKTLEEPPERTWFLLACREPAQLLATLRSRCSYWHLACPPVSLSLQWLRCRLRASEITVNDIDLLTALKLSKGAPVAAMQLLQPERWRQRYAVFHALQNALMQQDLMSGLLPLLNHEDVAERLYWLVSLLLDSLKWGQGAEAYIVNQDQRLLVQQIARLIAVSVLLKLISQWSQCRHQLLSITAVNRELLLTDQLISWESILTEKSYV